MSGGEESSVSIARKAWKQERRDSVIYYVLLSFTLIFLLLFIFVISLQFIEITGYASSISSRAGYITEVNLYSKRTTELWGGLYGLVLRVDGFTQQLSEDLYSGDVTRSDIFFDCIDQGATGGPEFYASTNASLDLLNSDVAPATTGMIDDLIGCSSSVVCANNTFVKNISIYLGDTEITNIPSTHTYKYTGENQIFDIGALNVSGQLVFVAHVNSTIQPGYNPDNLVNYQMLLPTPANTTQTYYFYSDPNDVCPPGGLGTTINASIYGTITNQGGDPVPNATITVAGYSTTSNGSGFYNLSTLLLEGTFSFLVQADDYDPHLSNVTITFTNNSVEKNAVLTPLTPSTSGILSVYIYGTVNDTAGNLLADANVSFGNGTATSDTNGEYNMTVAIVTGESPIIAVLTDYDNYVNFINITILNTTINHNISMDPANLNQFVTGPFTEQLDSTQTEDGQYDEPPTEVELTQETLIVNPSAIKRSVKFNTFFEDSMDFVNFRTSSSSLVMSVSPSLENVLELDVSSVTIPSGGTEEIKYTVYGTEPVGVYRGFINVAGDVELEIPARIEIIPNRLPIENLDLIVDIFNTVVRPGGVLKYRIVMNNLLSDQNYKVDLNQIVTLSDGIVELAGFEESIELDKSITVLREIPIPEDFEEDEYLLNVEATTSLDTFSAATSPFIVRKPLYLYSFFGVPLWLILVIISMLGFILLNLFLYKKHRDKKKRFHLELHTNLLPKPGDRSILLGRIAERSDKAYYNIDDLKTHMIVAGATGGGKSIAAQVFVEELLKKKIAIVVFDPTAQWSGMLRKCTDKKMMAFYPKFGLKPSDAMAFPGSVHQVTNHLQSINVNDYIQPGQIQIFTLNKLDPAQIDIFVAGVINNIFKADPQEYPELKTVFVFDEVHRLLPKFGGSGKGFLQIERACREFRKWGLGVMLVSQVLSDFVGEIKANINTELQMRVAEEKDLERIRERYGANALQSLVRAGIGTGMIQNAEYNRGLPYFAALRPILHNTRRLSDEVLEKYNNYNKRIEDLQYQIDQLDEEKVDTFDLKMELKLVKDKLMTGNFTVVDIYLEGLGPRLEKQWSALGKKPKEKEIELLDVSELESALDKAKKDREKYAKEHGGSAGEEKKEAKVDPAAKIVAPITFDNGAMISSLNELKDVLPTLDNAVYVVHVNKDKNEIAKWVEEKVDAALGKKMAGETDKAKLVEIINNFGKEDKKEKKDGDKKEEGKKEDEDKKEESEKKEGDGEKPAEEEKKEGGSEEKKEEGEKEEEKPAEEGDKPSE